MKKLIALGLTLLACWSARADSPVMSEITASSLGSNDWFYVIVGGSTDEKFNFGQLTNELGLINWISAQYVTTGLLTNQIPSTNVLVTALTLSPTSNATNYTVDLYPGPSGNLETIYMSNTNAFLTFTGTNQPNWHRTVLFRAWTNAIVSRIQFISPVRTNLNFVGYVTNGMAKVLNFYNPDTTGTNLLVSDAGFYQ